MQERRRVATRFDKETWSGRLVDLLNPTVDDIDFVDIAHSLANATRYDGHTVLPYTIAQHSCLVASLLPAPLRKHGLLHDAHESYLDDITQPNKDAFEFFLPGFKVMLREREAVFDNLIYARAGFALPTEEERLEIKRADLIALAIEQRDLMLADNVWNNPYAAGDHPRIRALPWQTARDNFIAALLAEGVSFGLSSIAA